MMGRGKRKCVAFYLMTALISTCYLMQSVDCLRLKKAYGRKNAVDAVTPVTEGKIVFGRVLDRGSRLESQVLDETRNSTAEDDAAYQADYAGLPWVPYAHPQEAAWRNMGTSLQCNGEQMRFKAIGTGASQFTVDQANGTPMLLSQVPPTCGYNMQRNSLALLMAVPYHGCNVVQEGGNYMLPMRWLGAPVSLLCPMSPAPASPTSAQTTTPSTSSSKTPSHPKIPPYFFLPPHFNPYTTKPTSSSETTTTKKPETPAHQVPKIPIPISYFPPQFYQPFTTAAPTTKKTTTTTTTEPADVQRPLPLMYIPQMPWVFHGPPQTTTTAKPKTTAANPQMQFIPIPPPGHPLFSQHPLHQLYFPLQKPEVVTTAATTTTEKPAASHNHPHFHILPYPHGYHAHKG